MKRIDLTATKFIPLVIILIPIAILFNLALLLLIVLDPRSWRFNKQEAHEVLERELQKYRDMPYRDCLTLIETDTLFNGSVSSESGTEYQIEIQMNWDGPAGGPIRVFGSIHDGRLRSYAPLTETFVIDAD